MSLNQPAAPQGPVLDLLWRQLNELNAVVDATNERWINLTRLEDKIMQTGQDESIREDLYEYMLDLESLQCRLEELRDTMRRTINEAVRPFLRPLNILDLPDELLRHIFLYVRGCTSMYKLSSYDTVTDDVKQIKKLRLTCRRFCGTSSHLLMFYVTVDMTAQSLAHLDRVSRHPLISKGIRAIKICLGRHFDRDIANDFGAFARYQRTRLRNCIDSWEIRVQHQSIFGTFSREVLQKAIGRGTAITDSFDKAVQHGLDETCPEHVLLRAAQESYRQQYECQLLLQRGSFAQAIVSAMMQMPAATCLSVQDQDVRPNSLAAWDFVYICPEDLDDLENLRLNFQAPSLSWSLARRNGLRSPPVDVIPSILSSIGQAGIHLVGLDIDASLQVNLSSFSKDQVELSKLQACLQHLKALACRPRHGVELSTLAVRLSTGFLSTILETSSLQRIDLCFDFMYRDPSGVQPTISLAPILLSHSWPNLKELSFNGPFQFHDLRNLVNHIDENVELDWGGYLMDESWAGVLDFLRDCRPHTTIARGDGYGSIAGAECEDMSDLEIDYIFIENGSESIRASGSRAVRYIRGWTTQNPITEWADGGLEILSYL